MEESRNPKNGGSSGSFDENLRATVGKTVDRTRGVYRNGQGFGWARIGS